MGAGLPIVTSSGSQRSNAIRRPSAVKPSPTEGHRWAVGATPYHQFCAMFTTVRTAQTIRPLAAGVATQTVGASRPFEEIPQPKFSVPYFGTILHYRLGFFSIPNRRETLLKLREDYGPIVREKFHGEEVVHLFDPEDYRLLFSTEGKSPAILPLLESIVQYRRQQGYAPGVGNINGEEWYTLRSAIRKLFMPPHAVKNFLQAQEEVTNDFIDRLYELRDPQSEMVPNLEFEIGKWNFETAGKVAFDRRLGTLSTGLNDVPAELIRINGNLFEKSVKLKFGLFPWYKLFNTPLWRKLIKEEDFFYGEVKRLFLDSLRECRQYIEAGNEDEDRFRFLRYLVSRDLPLSDSQITAQSLFTDGISTTVPTTVGQLYCLAANPDKQEKLFQEVRDVCDDAKEISYDMLTRMPFLRACVKECFRFFPIGLEVSRVTGKDLVLSGFHVPAGTAVDLNNFVCLQDSHFFSNPSKYLPERWLRKEATEKVHPYALTPFSHGPRQCLGRRFAEQEMYLLLAKMVRHFRLEWRGERPMKQRWRFLNIPDVPATIALIPR